jgi:hypothetical protein
MSFPRAPGAPLLLALLLLVPALLPVDAGEGDALERQLKAAYLYNITRYVDWPDDSVGDAFVIAVLDDPEFAAALRPLERPDKHAEGRPIRIRAISSPARAGAAQILFIGADAAPRLGAILGRTRGEPVLLVGDSPGLARRGVAVNFFLKPDILGDGDQLRFEINPSALQRRGLKVMSDLYDVGEVLR